MPAVLKKLDVAEYPHGVTMVGEIVSTDIIKDFLSAIESMMRSLHYTGLFDIDIFECNGQKYFGEINFRSSGVGYSLINTGANLPYLVSLALLGKNWRSVPVSAGIGKKYMYEDAAWRNHIKGFMTIEQLENLKKKADFLFVCGDSDDPEPEKFFLRKMRKNKLRATLSRTWAGRLLRRIIKGK